jgi:general stress protein 26
LTPSAGRTLAERKEHVLALLAHSREAWIASSDSTGRLRLIPMSLHWSGEYIYIWVDKSSRTAQNIMTAHSAMLALGNPRDVVLVKVTGSPVREAEILRAVANIYFQRSGWDPVKSPDYTLFELKPMTIECWRSDSGEYGDRFLMQGGRWLA